MFDYSIKLNSKSDSTYGINNLELVDGFYGKSLADMNGYEVEEIRCSLIDAHQKIVLYTAQFDIHEFEKYTKLFRYAHLLGIKNVLIPSKYLGSPCDIEAIKKNAKVAVAFDIRILFEIENDVADFRIDQYLLIKEPNIGFVFNPAEFSKMNMAPYSGVLHASKLRRKDVYFLRINDIDKFTGEPKLPDEGTVELKENLSAIVTRKEPCYFAYSDYMGGNLPEVMKRAQDLLKLM